METRTTTLTQFGQYDMVQWTGANRSGFQPCCDMVLILPDQASERWKSVILPDEVVANTGLAAMTGVLVALGDQAFAYDSRRLVRWEGKRPQPGDRVWFVKYAGLEFTGKDGLMYRSMEDRQVAGLEIDVPDEEQREVA